jgi:hypothetical protein
VKILVERLSVELDPKSLPEAFAPRPWAMFQLRSAIDVAEKLLSDGKSCVVMLMEVHEGEGS